MMTAACRKCGLPLKFVEREHNGTRKLTPINPDGTDHWPICRQKQLPPKPVEPPPTCDCKSPAPELHRCSANNAVTWQCGNCNRKLTKWLPRSELGGVDIASLPEYVRAALD